MPSAASSKRPNQPRHDDIDNYDAGDLSDDPFLTPSPQASKKRKDGPQSGLGIDKEVSVQKRVRVPNIKLDEDRLLGPGGIPKLRSKASTSLKLKGKGHEFGDAARLLSFYQLWLDDLFPKARFLDALAMVEKAGHKKKLMAARHSWIDEGKHKALGGDKDAEVAMAAPETLEPKLPSTFTAPSEQQCQQTPQQDDYPDDDDLYGSTPQKKSPPVHVDVPGSDELDGLMAEAEQRDAPQSNGRQDQIAVQQNEPEDDMDALVAEAENHDRNGKSEGARDPDFAEEEAAMQEMDGLW
ncbi:replication fork protection complex subunit Csm3/Swi3 [Geosmithia morbida]|uniref:Chromosome segregation in meiosis protein n=1 Tax=Geosmithia morbida TaxID=1094350 RepID=A0A9P4YM20_9HYPO|nr:replication fork protection complex subunit Csm3/Swi3 [Geosmithia morbida]KAF4119468.1 replication fork protection complex subunit Csm3/Swi3 [Geosmithia morbida]